MSAKQKSTTEAQAGEQVVAPPIAPVPETTIDDDNGTGAIRISETVIAAVVRKYTLDVAGVVRFASGSIVGGLAEMIGRRTHEGSVVVEIDGETVNIGVTLVLEFGVCIPEVACLVQDVVRARVEEITGKHVTRVDVIVQDLEDAPAADKAGVEQSE